MHHHDEHQPRTYERLLYPRVCQEWVVDDDATMKDRPNETHTTTNMSPNSSETATRARLRLHGSPLVLVRPDQTKDPQCCSTRHVISVRNWIELRDPARGGSSKHVPTFSG